MKREKQIFEKSQGNTSKNKGNLPNFIFSFHLKIMLWKTFYNYFDVLDLRTQNNFFQIQTKEKQFI